MNDLYISAIQFSSAGKAAATSTHDLYMLHKLVYAALSIK